MIQIDQASLGLAREHLLAGITDPFVRAYHDYQIALAVAFGAIQADAEQEMEEVLAFETELARVGSYHLLQGISSQENF